ncbi:hypothetical protein D3C72_2541460 [compost metagenome]
MLSTIMDGREVRKPVAVPAMMPAPVGVVSSIRRRLSATGMPRIISRVAGAGTGYRP